MSNYWATFECIGGDVFRFDTRIYIHPTTKLKNTDTCIGAVAGVNPGSGIPLGGVYNIPVEIDLDGDNLLPCVKSIISKAATHANITIPPNSYIQVLNIMYICDKNLTSAINKINNHPNPKTCTTETNFFPFIWYVWGNSKKELNNFKNRFDSINAGCHFFYHTKENKFLTNQPKLKEPARHTQGLKHDLVVTRISLCL